MNKLQLYITKSFGNYQGLIKVNPSEEVSRYICELRNIVEKVSYDSTEKNIFYYVTNISTGTFVTIIRTIPTEPVDHLAAWIYIPNELIIEGSTLERIINVTTRKVSGDRVTTDDVANLRELFATEYMTDVDAPLMTASNQNGELAWRRYNGESGMTLTTLLGPGLFQLPYLDYCGVLFVDEELGLTVEGADLTDMPIAGPAVILPVERTPENFVAYVFGRSLIKPVRATLDTNLAIVWKHPGFEDVVSEEVIDKGEFSPTLPDTSESRKAITKGSFQITSHAGAVPMDDCNITVNGHEITDEPRLFTTAELSGAMVAITCEGYAPYSAKMDLASSTRALAKLQERTKIYCFEMPVKSTELGAPVRFKIYTKKVLTESPLEGYVAQDDIMEGEARTNHLAYSGANAGLITKAIYAGIGLVVGLLLAWLCNCGGKGSASKDASGQDSVPKTEQTSQNETKDNGNSAGTSQTPAASAQPVSTDVTAEAIAYLDNNKAWTKEQLDQYPCLVGLYEDLNTFQLEKISGDWATKLSNSKKFTTLAKFAKNGSDKVKRGKLKLPDTYNKSTDTKISVTNYQNKIDP